MVPAQDTRLSTANRSHHDLSFWEETRSPIVHFCHRGIFVLAIAILVFAPLAFGSVRLWAQGLIVIMVALATVLWIVRLTIVSEVQVVFSSLGAPMLVLATYGVVRCALAEVEPIARPDMLMIVSAALFFFLVLNNIRHRWQITTLVWTLTGLGTVLSVYGLWQVIHRGSNVWFMPQYEAYLGRASGTFMRPADLAVYLQLIVAIVATNFFFSQRPLNEKTIFALVGIALCGALLLTRAYVLWLGWLATALVVAVYVVRKKRWNFRWLIIGTLVLAVVVAVTFYGAYSLHHHRSAADEQDALPPLFNRQSLGSHPGQEPDSQLIKLRPTEPLWRTALALGQKNLWWGIGPRMFEWVYPGTRSWQGRVRGSASAYLNVFAEYGLIGCLIHAWVIIAFARAILQILDRRTGRYSAARPSNRFAFAIAGLATLAAITVDGAFDLNLRVGANFFTLLAILTVSLTCGIHRRAGEEQIAYEPGRYTAVRLSGLSRLVLVVALTGLLTVLVARLWRTYPSYLFVRRGDHAARQLDWVNAQQNYLRAWNADRRNFEAAAALGDLFAARATWNSRQRDAYCAEAFRWYQRALTVNPYYYRLHICMGRLNDALGYRALARENFQTALAGDPKNTSYQAQFGCHALRWGDTELAEKCFRLARELGGTDALPALELQKTPDTGA
jgi:tetratricopeptide (TPR) repeat protein